MSFAQALLDTIPFPFWVLDAQGSLVAANQASREVFPEVCPGSSCTAWADGIAEVLRGEAAQRVAEVGRTCGGAERWFRVQTTRVACDAPDARATVLHTEIIERDDRWRYAMDSAGDGVWDWNLRTNEVYFSQQWKAMLGFRDDEIGNSLEEWAKRVHPDDIDWVMEAVNDHLEGRTPAYRTEHRLLGKNGAVHWILDRGKVVLRDGERNPLRFVGTHSDTTQRKQLELEIERLNSLLSALTHVNQAMVRVTCREQLLEEVCRALVQYGGFSGATILEGDGAGGLQIGASAGHAAAAPLTGLPDSTYLCDAAAGEDGFGSFAAFPIRVGGSLCGTLIVHSDECCVFPEREVALLEKIAADVSFALDYLAQQEEQKVAALKLRESKEHLALALEAAGAGTWDWNLITNAVIWGGQSEALLGYGPGEFGGTFDGFICRVHPADREDVGRAIQASMETQSVYSVEFRVIWPSGEVRWLAAHGIFDYDVTGRAVRMRGVDRDITAAKAADEALREQTQLMRKVVEGAHEGIIVYDRELRYQLWNPFMEQITGVPASEVVGRTPQEVFPFVEEARLMPYLRRALAGEYLGTVEFAYSVPSGASGWASDTSSPLRNASGEIVGVIGMVTDITERRHSQEALRASEEQFRAMFDLASVGMVQVNPANGTVLRCNEKFRQITGYTDAELKAMSFVKLTHPDDRERDWELFRGALRGETANYQNEKRYVRKDGSIVWVRLNASFIRDEAGAIQRTVAICEDITAWKKAETAREEVELRFRRAFESFPFPAAVYADDGQTLLLNQAWTDISGYRQSEIPTIAAWTRRAYPGRSKQVAEKVARLFDRDGVTVEGEVAIMTACGTQRMWDFRSCSLGFDSEGRRLVMSTAVDVTARNEAESALRESEEQHRIGHCQLGHEPERVVP